MDGKVIGLLLAVCIMLACAAQARAIEVSASTEYFESVQPGQLNIVYAEKVYYPSDEPLTLHFQVFNSTGMLQDNSTTTCTLNLYNESGNRVLSSALNQSLNSFLIQLNESFTTAGRHAYTVWCNTSTAGGFLTAFYVNNIDGKNPSDSTSDLTPIAVLIIVPMLLAFLMLIGAITLDPVKHAVVKIGLFLASMLPFYVSLYFGIVTAIHYYDFVELQDAVSSSVWWFGSLFVVIICYFLMYAFYVMLEKARQKKEEKLQY